MKKKHFAVILSGCGVFDGSEIHEATLLLLAIKKAGHDWHAFAPDINQETVRNHYSNKAMAETRNVLAESARIARAQIEPLDRLDVAGFDAICIPGGFGTMQNLCDYGSKGADYTVLPLMQAVLEKARDLGKPVGATCVAPLLLTQAFRGCQITLGGENNEAIAAEKQGAVHISTRHGETVVDTQYKLVTTPAYMLDDADIAQVANGIDNMVAEILKLV